MLTTTSTPPAALRGTAMNAAVAKTLDLSAIGLTVLCLFTALGRP